MATKKKSKKVKKSQRVAGEKAKAGKRARKIEASRKASAPRKRKSTARGTTLVGKRSHRKKNRIYDHHDGAVFAPENAGLRTGGQSGDLQGLRDIETSDAESVDELLEEGNAFEADFVAGVEHAESDNPREVRTHEVPEDDVPEEYLDKDS
jgi:hypothetical protein